MSETPKGSLPDSDSLKHDVFDDFERLVNCSQDAIYRYDLDSREFHFINRTFKTYFDIQSKADIATVSDQAVLAIHSEDREQALSAFHASLKNGDTEGEVEYRVQSPDGGIRFLHDRWIVLRNSNCDPIASRGSFVITLKIIFQKINLLKANTIPVT